MIKIDKKIVAFNVVKDDKAPSEVKEMSNKEVKTLKEENCSDVVKMHESIQRPDVLTGTTYRIKPPVSEHAIYITINDIVLNQGSQHESKHPYEVFINSKSMEHFQWIVVLTRIVSALFRKGGDIEFIIDEMRSVFDPKGGYFSKGRYINSIVSEIADIIEIHLKSIGIIKEKEKDPHIERFLREKREKIEQDQKPAKSKTSKARTTSSKKNTENHDAKEDAFPENAILCNKCNHKAAILLDNCFTCLNCGDSKCG